ncbi:MAG TPA: ribonuclease III [Candidatus Paceibacterota bacterium]
MPQPDFHIFEKTVGITFRNLKLLEQAFTHRSYLNENLRSGLNHNERLEFLGDAVLELATTDYLYRHYPDKTEGDLTAYRAALVNTVTIAQVAADIGLNDYLLLSRGEAKDIGRARQAILANTFESLIGAFYLDQGFEVAQGFINKYLIPRVGQVIAERRSQDAKSFFQERAQAETDITPAYELLRESGPDHDKTFTVGLYIGKELMATGSGHSKQEAEQVAAREGLKRRGWTE